MAILVLGLGNLIMQDDALGSRVVTSLEQEYAPVEGLHLLDGGTLGLDLLPRFEGIDKLLIVDALEMGAEAGTLFRLQGEEVPRAFAGKLSVHQMGLQDLLAVAELQGNLPQELVVIGCQSACVEMGMEMTAAVAASFPQVVAAVISQLRDWGCELQPIDA